MGPEVNKKEAIVRIVCRSAQYAEIVHESGIVANWVAELKLDRDMSVFEEGGYQEELGRTIEFRLEDCRHFMKDTCMMGLLLTNDSENAIRDLPVEFRCKGDTRVANFAKLVWKSDTLQILYENLYIAIHLYHTWQYTDVTDNKHPHRFQW